MYRAEKPLSFPLTRLHSVFIILMVGVCTHAQLCLTLCDPMDCSLPGFSVHGISQARILEWVAISSSRASCWLRHQTHVCCVSCIGRRILDHCITITWEAPMVGEEPPNPLAFTTVWFRPICYAKCTYVCISWRHISRKVLWDGVEIWERIYHKERG